MSIIIQFSAEISSSEHVCTQRIVFVYLPISLKEKAELILKTQFALLIYINKTPDIFTRPEKLFRFLSFCDKKIIQIPDKESFINEHHLD